MKHHTNLPVAIAEYDPVFFRNSTLGINNARRGRDGRDHNGVYLLNGEPHPRPFCPWDGEGITHEEGKPQSYVLFGCGYGEYVSSATQLTTEQCLDLILRVEESNPAAIHVGFAFKYDVEMILADISVRHWNVLRSKGTVRWHGYSILYHPGKKFTVSRRVNGQKTTATIYDVWGFFQSSFVYACITWLPDDNKLTDIDAVLAGKKRRGSFTVEELDYIKQYWQMELGLLAQLCNKLRDDLTYAGICPQTWHGPGAIAQVVFRQHETRKRMSRTQRDVRNDADERIATLPEAVNDAARRAYAGGRFEMFRVGHWPNRVYQYDINSAYPDGISTLPDLSDGEWEHKRKPFFVDGTFALWHIEFDAWHDGAPFHNYPLFYRDERRCVSYPYHVDGWYWTPEAAIVANTPQARIVEAWIWNSASHIQPFAFVRDIYAQRQEWKREGNGAEKALKLALNSLYGKMAQRAGWQEKRPLPRYHQLEWAGYVTSHTRAKLWHAMNLAGPFCVAVETDALFSAIPLDLPVSKRLGEWSLTEHEYLTYLQSGFYFTDTKAAYRGLDDDSITHEQSLAWLHRGDWGVPLVGTTTRFVGAGRGLGTPQHRCWVTEPREIWPGRTGKRRHHSDYCGNCRKGLSASEHLHPTFVATRGGISLPHSLPWLDGERDDPFDKECIRMNYDHVFAAA